MSGNADPKTWRMHANDAPLFNEYLHMGADAGFGDIVSFDNMEVVAGDVLVVVDMQNDFVPVDSVNADGGAFAVPEGGGIAPIIVRLMDHFISKGGMVVATRDYHPDDHCSFIGGGGHFPPHCIQGSVGSHFYQPIGRCIQKHKKNNMNCEVVFKGFHEDAESFGSFEYPDDAATWQRISNRDTPPNRLHGCSLVNWTGACLLKCSNCSADVNAPPDILAAHRRQDLKGMLQEKGAKRIFACGVAMDFCVLDTVLNAQKAGFDKVFMILDAARAAYIPGVGQHGSGFLSDPAEMKTKLAGAGARLVPCSALIPNFQVQAAVKSNKEIHAGFPASLGPFALVRAMHLVLQFDKATMTYKVTKPDKELDMLKTFNVEPQGVFTAATPITLVDDARQQLGIPDNATQFLWAYPVTGTSKFQDPNRAYFSITTPNAAFIVYGGFVYLDDKENVVAIRAIRAGSGLDFSAGQKWRAEYTEALAKRWHPVTIPFLTQRGATHFAWVNPMEELQADNGGEPWRVCEHGAFVYLFHADVNARSEADVFFAVAGTDTEMNMPIGRVGSNDVHTAHIM